MALSYLLSKELIMIKSKEGREKSKFLIGAIGRVNSAAVHLLQWKHCSLIWSQIVVIEKSWAMPFEMCAF